LFYNEISVKGKSTITFDFTHLDTLYNNILRARIDYGDGTEVEELTYSGGLDHLNQPITYYFALYGAYSPLLLK